MSNIHRQTFEEIISLNPKSSSDRKKVYLTDFRTTFKNYGNIFGHSFMCEKSFHSSDLLRHIYAEEVAAKYKCKISYNTIYTTSGDPSLLVLVRNKLIEKMYVSPIIWTPMKVGNFIHLKTFSFGFFPYCDKKFFVYDDSVSIETIPFKSEMRFNEMIEYNLSTETLHKMISQRIKLIDVGATPSLITLDKNELEDNPKLYYHISNSHFENKTDVSKYQDCSSAKEFFDRVISDNDAECFLIPEYKLLFVKTLTSMYLNERVDTENRDKLNTIHDILSKKIAVSDVSSIIYNECYCHWFSYDDTNFDDVSHHFGFFDTWNYFD